jgi:hypothetical protein
VIGKGNFFHTSLFPYGIGSTDGYPSSPHSSGRRPNPGGEIFPCTKISRFALKDARSSGRLSKGDECLGTDTARIPLRTCTHEGFTVSGVLAPIRPRFSMLIDLLQPLFVYARLCIADCASNRLCHCSIISYRK